MHADGELIIVEDIYGVHAVAKLTRGVGVGLHGLAGGRSYAEAIVGVEVTGEARRGEGSVHRAVGGVGAGRVEGDTGKGREVVDGGGERGERGGRSSCGFVARVTKCVFGM